MDKCSLHPNLFVGFAMPRLKYLSLLTRKYVFGGLDPVRLKPACSTTETRLKSSNFGFCKYMYYTILTASNKGADQTVWMRRLICAFVVRIWHKTGFLMIWLTYHLSMYFCICFLRSVCFFMGTSLRPCI